MTRIVIKDLENQSQNSCQTLDEQHISAVKGGCGGMKDTLGVPTLDSLICCLAWL